MDAESELSVQEDLQLKRKYEDVLVEEEVGGMEG